ncbi:MAG: type II secretion system F family protein [Bacilli bacterium]|nr:type II secretion system F family protein [Bacilli bacterium]
MEGLSINYIDSTNEDVVVTYTPSSLVSSYSYVIVKDNIYNEPIYVETNTPVNIILNQTGTYRIEITNIDYKNVTSNIVSGEYKIDKETPVINISEKTYQITSKEGFDVMGSITATDNVDGDLTSSIATNKDTLDFSSEGIKKIQYKVSDKAGNTATEFVYVTVRRDNTDIIRLGQFGILLFFLFGLLFLLKYIRSIKLEKRFSKYTINSSKNKSISLFDNLYNQYRDFLEKVSKVIGKLEIVKKGAKRYDKYIEAFEKEDSNINFISKKIIVGFLFVVFIIVVKLIEAELAKPFEMFIPFLLGYITLDIVYAYKYIRYKKKIENDMLEAITVMNNAFKAGMSITQAVDLVARELEGPISKEFKKIGMEISLGLDMETAFKRFSDRINLSEAIYLTASISVLNKTGGNIIKVFNSIEKTIFNRKKLENEFKALTSSSKLIMYVLIIVPIAFVVFISLINKDYFKVLFNNPLGVALLIIILIIYITYIVVVRKVMKVRGIK